MNDPKQRGSKLDLKRLSEGNDTFFKQKKIKMHIFEFYLSNFPTEKIHKKLSKEYVILHFTDKNI